MCQTGGNYKVLQRYSAEWGISAEHFSPYATSRGPRSTRRALDEILIEDSTYSRNHLKARLYAEGLKEPVCELCGQGEIWRGRPMGLILDHVNGVSNDNRFANLRIVCPNCAATLDTHCGRARRLERVEQSCERCGRSFRPNCRTQRYCSRECGMRWDRSGLARPSARRVDRPPHSQLVREVNAIGFSATGRRYGVSDNAVRKWLRQYERGAQASEAA